jgi:hypothetical protein
MPDEKKGLPEGKPLKDTAKAVESNHNTVDTAKPVPVATITDPKHAKPDYNPMRREGGPANVKSDTSMNEDDNAAVVGEKGDRQTAEDNERDRLNSIPDEELSQGQLAAKRAVNEEKPKGE